MVFGRCVCHLIRLYQMNVLSRVGRYEITLALRIFNGDCPAVTNLNAGFLSWQQKPQSWLLMAPSPKFEIYTPKYKPETPRSWSNLVSEPACSRGRRHAACPVNFPKDRLHQCCCLTPYLPLACWDGARHRGSCSRSLCSCTSHWKGPP